MNANLKRRAGWALGCLVAICVPATPAFAHDYDQFTPITDCGTVISEPGYYKLVNPLLDCDVTDPLGRPFTFGVSIASSKVVLDLDGHTISCSPGPLPGVGVWTEEYLSELRIVNGTVTGCFYGVGLNLSKESVVKDMLLTANLQGVQVFGGKRNKIRANEISRNFDAGINLNSFNFDGSFVGFGFGHKIYENLVIDNGWYGIDTNSIEEANIYCNRVDRNFGGVSITDPGYGNRISGNVTNNNRDGGIALIGFGFDGAAVFQPIPAGNTVKGNIALGNPRFDVLEGFLDFLDDVVKPNPDGVCLNTWAYNLYGSPVAAAGCIAPPVPLDEQNGCAPGTDNDNDKRENILSDASFEKQLPADKGGWILFDPNISFFSSDRARSGYQSLFNSAYLGVAGSFQQFAVKPGSRWRLIGYGLTPEPLVGDGVFGIVQFSFFNEDGIELGTVETAGQEFPALASNRVDGSTPHGRWNFLDTGIGTAPEGTATIQAFTLYVDFSGNVQGMYFDDLKLCALKPNNKMECRRLRDKYHH